MMDACRELVKSVVRVAVPADFRMAVFQGRQQIRQWPHDVSQWLYDRLPDAYVQGAQFKQAHGRRLNFAAPATFNEKLHWLIRHHRDPVMTQLADKYAVRDYVAARLGSSFLNDLYGVWDDPTAIPFDALPESYVLKVNHGSGQNIFCRETARLNRPKIRAQLAQWLRRSEYWHSREWAYKDIPPRILCERLLSDEQGNVPADYKIFCFNGQPGMIQVDIDRFAEHQRDLFDSEWQPLPFSLEYPPTGQAIPRPATLDVMLSAAKTLSQGFPFVRVDLYSIRDRVIFGEMTWYPEGGLGHFMPESADRALGDLLNLPAREQGRMS